ncbi:hypothetical protein APR11_005508 [Nocardia amikacinitolerans]|nr:hypothetical protein [Nocardia amikacinitolerans]MCP2299058.1 hypothetical protein [Nocardia amikacinitolerans]
MYFTMHDFIRGPTQPTNGRSAGRDKLVGSLSGQLLRGRVIKVEIRTAQEP